MDADGLAYTREDNCFPWVEDWQHAQRLLNQQLTVDWPSLLSDIAVHLNPMHAQLFSAHPAAYYWSTYQSEWAIDVVFHDAATLRQLYPRLVQQAMTAFSSLDVMRFLGRRLPLSGQLPTSFNGQIVTDLREREEGVRIRHRLNTNSVKLYDKPFSVLGSVLRAESTLNSVDDFRVYRPKEGLAQDGLDWRPLRRGIADLQRRAELGRRAAERYLDALGSLDLDTTLDEVVHRLSQPRYWHGRRVRALHPFDPDDRRLLQLINRGEFTLNGLRNRDLQQLYFRSPALTPTQARRRSAWVGRKLRLLRAHGLIYKITGTHRYQLTTAGRQLAALVLTALASTLRQLTATAA
jgi:hypothetical protein